MYNCHLKIVKSKTKGKPGNATYESITNKYGINNTIFTINTRTLKLGYLNLI